MIFNCMISKYIQLTLKIDVFLLSSLKYTCILFVTYKFYKNLMYTLYK